MQFRRVCVCLSVCLSVSLSVYRMSVCVFVCMFAYRLPTSCDGRPSASVSPYARLCGGSSALDVGPGPSALSGPGPAPPHPPGPRPAGPSAPRPGRQLLGKVSGAAKAPPHRRCWLKLASWSAVPQAATGGRSPRCWGLEALPPQLPSQKGDAPERWRHTSWMDVNIYINTHYI